MRKRRSDDDDQFNRLVSAVAQEVLPFLQVPLEATLDAALAQAKQTFESDCKIATDRILADKVNAKGVGQISDEARISARRSFVEECSFAARQILADTMEAGSLRKVVQKTARDYVEGLMARRRRVKAKPSKHSRRKK